MKKRPKSITQPLTQCPKCHHQTVKPIQTGQYFFLLSALPFLTAVILTFVVHPIFLAGIPIVAWMNVRVAKKKTPPRHCTNCNHFMTPQKQKLSNHA